MRFNPQIVAGANAIGHSGWIHGYLTLMAYLPDHGVTVALMLNEINDGLMGAVADGVIRTTVEHVSR